jgi:hypothetical protein
LCWSGCARAQWLLVLRQCHPYEGQDIRAPDRQSDGKESPSWRVQRQFMWAHRAARSGHAAAQYWLGHHHINISERIVWLAKAKDQGWDPVWRVDPNSQIQQ